MRGRAQETWGDFPAKGDTLDGSNGTGADELVAGTGGEVGDATIKANKTNDTNFRIRFDAGSVTATNAFDVFEFGTRQKHNACEAKKDK